MYCSQCGKKIYDDARFCPHCGAPVVKPDADDARSEGLFKEPSEPVSSEKPGSEGAGASGAGASGGRDEVKLPFSDAPTEGKGASGQGMKQVTRPAHPAAPSAAATSAASAASASPSATAGSASARGQAASAVPGAPAAPGNRAGGAVGAGQASGSVPGSPVPPAARPSESTPSSGDGERKGHGGVVALIIVIILIVIAAVFAGLQFSGTVDFSGMFGSSRTGNESAASKSQDDSQDGAAAANSAADSDVLDTLSTILGAVGSSESADESESAASAQTELASATESAAEPAAAPAADELVGIWWYSNTEASFVLTLSDGGIGTLAVTEGTSSSSFDIQWQLSDTTLTILNPSNPDSTLVLEFADGQLTGTFGDETVAFISQ